MSKWVEASPVPKRDALCVVICISTAIYRFGAVKTVYCSQSTGFCDEVTNHLCDRWNIVQKVSPVEQPQLSALYDRSSSMLREAIRQVVTEKQAEWDDFLDPVLFVFHTSTTRFTPYYLMFNKEASLPSEMEVDILKYHQVQDICPVKKESISCFVEATQEQQKTVKQLVVANVNAAYRQQKRNAKRKARSIPSISMADPSFGSGDSPPLKKESPYLSFPVTTVLAAKQTDSQRQKD